MRIFSRFLAQGHRLLKKQGENGEVYSTPLFAKKERGAFSLFFKPPFVTKATSQWRFLGAC
jgi:hypothetical protein